MLNLANKTCPAVAGGRSSGGRALGQRLPYQRRARPPPRRFGEKSLVTELAEASTTDRLSITNGRASASPR